MFRLAFMRDVFMKLSMWMIANRICALEPELYIEEDALSVLEAHVWPMQQTVFMYISQEQTQCVRGSEEKLFSGI